MRPITENPSTLALSNLLADPLLIVAMLLLLRFAYLIFDHPLRTWFWTLQALGVAIAVLVTVDQDWDAFGDFWWFVVIVVLETLRKHLQAVRAGRGFALILVGGGIGLLIGLGWQMLLNAGLLEAPFSIFPVAYYGVASLLLSASLFIAFVFARLARTLEERLVQVEELSRRTLAQELEAKEREVARRLLEADNQRKTGELEAARDLQLSLLPARVAADGRPARRRRDDDRDRGRRRLLRLPRRQRRAHRRARRRHRPRRARRRHGVADEGDVLDLRRARRTSRGSSAAPARPFARCAWGT